MCSKSIKRALAIALTSIVTAILLSFLFWPIPPETVPREALSWLSQVSIDEPEEFDLESVQDEIRTSMEQLLKSYPRDHRALHLSGIVYSELKQTANAERMLRSSLVLEPNDSQVRLDLARLLLSTGRDMEALEILEIDSELGTTQIEFTCLLAETQTRVGQLSEAVMTLQTGLNRFPNAAKPWRMLGELQLQQSDYALAESSLRKSIEMDMESEPAYFALCQSLALQNKSVEAIEARRKFDELRKQNLSKQKSFEEVHKLTFRRFACSSFRSIAILYQDHGDLENTKRSFDRSTMIDPADLQTLSLVANYNRKLGNFETAAEMCRRIVFIQPEVFTNYSNLASLCMEAGNTQLAEATLQLAADRNVGGGLSHLQLARFRLLANKPAEAVSPARRAVREMETVETYLVLIAALDTSEQYDQATQVRTQARSIAPNDERFREKPK